MKNLWLVLFVICSFSSFSQEDSYNNKLNQLEQKLNNTNQPGLKIPIYKQIIKLSFPDHLDKVFEKSNELNELSKSLNNAEANAFSLFYLAEYYFSNDDYKNANDKYQEALALYQSLENTGQIIQVYHKLGLANQYLNNYDDALRYYQKSVEVAESIGSLEKEGICYQDIGTLYNDIEKYSLAQDYYEKALAIFEQINNKERIAAIYQNIGVLQYNWGNYDKSLDFYKKSLRIYEEVQNKENIAISLSNIGLVYESFEDYKMALVYYQNALLIFEEMGSKTTLVYIFYNLGSIYRNIGNYKKSIDFFEKGLNLSKEISMKDYISYNYHALAGVYEELGNYAKALNNYKKFVIIKDSLFNEEKHRQISELEAKFQNAKHEKEIEFLKLGQELQESKLKKKETQNLILIFSSILTLIIAFMLLFFAKTQRNLSVKLKNEIKEHKDTENQLNKIRRELEERVVERTKDIEEANIKLRHEIEEHKKTMINLEYAKNKAEEADRLKSNFLANISHEVRTPMNAIKGFSQMLAFNNLSVRKRNDYINLIQDGCNNLTNLIDDIVDFASIESGQAKIEKKEFNPHPILEFLYDHYTNEIVKREIENIILVYSNENRDDDIIINTDPSRLKQILSILIDNALKFTEKGKIEFGFTYPKQNEIQFYVRDTGIGIDEKYHNLIFERFRQIDEGTTKKYGGSGIGLSVAKNLVELLGGKIFLDSSPGRGTTFYFNLPYKSEKGAKNEFVQPNQFNWKDKVILIAEDKKINFEILQETLIPTNAELLWAKNGEEAVNLVKTNNHIDVILLDIQMPVMDGYECAKRIKEMTREIPIVAQTAYSLQQDANKCFEAGCDDYIAKPISLDQFLVKLQKYLS